MNQYIERIEKAFALGGEHLSDWERGFLESLKSQAEKGRSLSVKQVDILERVEKQKCSPEAREEAVEWNKLYKSEKRDTAITVAKYYKSQGTYFLGLAVKILDNPDFVPSKKAYQKLCENKYAKRILSELAKPPVFSVGDVVCLRHGADNIPTARYRISSAMRLKPMLVLSVDTETIESAVKGAKRYTLLPYGSTDTHVFEERALKRYKKPKKTSKKTKTSEEIPF